jgi:hypothetical protein
MLAICRLSSRRMSANHHCHFLSHLVGQLVLLRSVLQDAHHFPYFRPFALGVRHSVRIVIILQLIKYRLLEYLQIRYYKSIYMIIASLSKSTVLLLFLLSILDCSIMPEEDEVNVPIPNYQHQKYSGIILSLFRIHSAQF